MELRIASHHTGVSFVDFCKRKSVSSESAGIPDAHPWMLLLPRIGVIGGIF